MFLQQVPLDKKREKCVLADRCVFQAAKRTRNHHVGGWHELLATCQALIRHYTAFAFRVGSIIMS